MGDRADAHRATIRAGFEEARQLPAGLYRAKFTAVHASGDHHARAGTGAVEDGHRDVDREGAQIGVNSAAHLAAGPGPQRADGERRVVRLHASTRPTVLKKSVSWGDPPSSARSAATSPKPGESLKHWPEKSAS